MIQVEDLRKEYDGLMAVDGVSFDAVPGAIFGLLGPNGAGKSTTIGCISGLLEPTSGRVRVMGHDIRRDGVLARSEMGVVPQELAVYEDLSASENLNYWGAAYGLGGDALRRRVRDVLGVVGLSDRASEPVKRFSGGMKRRLNFACGIVHGPAVLLLDEPTVGVDPQSRVRLLEVVRAQAAEGACVLYTTHYMEEAASLCDRLAIMDRGRVIALGSLAELRALVGERDLLRLSGRFESEAAREALRRIPGAEIVQAEAALVILALAEGSRKLPEVLGAVAAAGGEIRETTLTQPSLESLFIKLTGKELRE